MAMTTEDEKGTSARPGQDGRHGEHAGADDAADDEGRGRGEAQGSGPVGRR
jgi:hypothetical protein